MPTLGVNGTTLNLEHIVLKANNASAWSSDYVLAAGELGIELDTKKYKLGDGTTQWSELAYYSNPVTDTLVSGLTERVTTAEGTLTSLGSRMDTAESTITSHGTRIGTAEDDIDALEGRMDTAESDIDSAEGRLDTAESSITSHGTRLDTAEGNITSQGSRITALEGITTLSANPFRE